MATEYEYTVTLYGNSEKLQWAEDIIDKATCDASTEMEDFLHEYGVSVSEGYKDADCHHLSLLSMLFCREDEKRVVANEAWRDFLSGCRLEEDGTLELYCRIAGDVDGFFSSLVEHSDYLESYEAVYDEDEDEYGDDEEEYDKVYEMKAEEEEDSKEYKDEENEEVNEGYGDDGKEYTVTLYGDKEKLKWAEGIIKEAIHDDYSGMDNFLSKYSISVPKDYIGINCDILALLVLLFCEENVEKIYKYDPILKFHYLYYGDLIACNLKEDGALKVVCSMHSDESDFFDSLVKYSDCLSSYDIKDGVEEINETYTEEKEHVNDEEITENPISKSSTPLIIEIYGNHNRLEMAHRIISILLEDKSTLCSVFVLSVVFNPIEEQEFLSELGDGVSIVGSSLENTWNKHHLNVRCQLNQIKRNNKLFNHFLQHLCEYSQFINRISLKKGAISHDFTKGDLAKPVNAF